MSVLYFQLEFKCEFSIILIDFNYVENQEKLTFPEKN